MQWNGIKVLLHAKGGWLGCLTLTYYSHLLGAVNETVFHQSVSLYLVLNYRRGERKKRARFVHVTNV